MEPSGLSGLRALGCAVTYEPEASDADALSEAVRKSAAEVLIVRSTKVPSQVIDAAEHLNLIIRAGAGYDTIDVNEASARGIFVANCPGKNSIAVAELAWALLLCCDRQVPDQTIELREGKWSKKQYAKKARGLHGRTLGIVGLGQIGLEVARRGQAFGMHVAAWSRSLTQEKADELGVFYCSSLINLAKMADVVSVHVAATGDTANLIDGQFIGAMKDGAYLINTSRGSVVDEQALRTAIQEKELRAGLDVYTNEPGASDKTFDDDIVNLPGVYGTHHVAASTDQAQEAVAAETVRIVDGFIRTGEVCNCINRAASTPATTMLTVRHLNKPGVLAHVFYTLGQAGINVEEMENIIYEGARAACARIQLDDRPNDDDLNAIRHNDNVLSVAIAGIEHG